MKKTRRQVAIIFLVIIIIVISVGSIVKNRMVKQAIPDYNEIVNIPSLQEQVTVYRDSAGVPHIEAANQYDLYLVTGYLMAQDRLWQMDLLRRVTLGRLSEIFGVDYVETDQLLRALRFQKKSQKILDSATPGELISLQAYADGINYYIETHNKKLPLEFKLLGYAPEKWEPIHSLNLIGYMGWDLKSGWSEIYLNDLAQKLSAPYLLELYPKNNQAKPALFYNGTNIGETLLQQSKLEKLGTEILHGSNNWVVNGKKTASGYPLLANDMHLGFGIPGIWYQIHQIVKDSLNVTGVALPGAPVIVVGHNDSIAWGMTNTYVKNIDFYEETISSSDSLKYKYDGEWLPIISDTLLIYIKGEDDPVKRVNYFTHHGPVISGIKNIPDKTITMKWVGDIDGNEFRSVYEVNRAHNWSAFVKAFGYFQSISQNVNYADKKGNIGLIAAAGVPLRKDPERIIFPGDTSLYEWKGVIQQEELPAILNPAKNYIVTANNLTTPDDYPYYIGSWHALPYRFNRISQLIESDSILDATDYMRIQNDRKNLHAQQVITDLLTYWNNSNHHDTTYNHYVGLLNEWDFMMDIHSVPATIYNRFSYEFMYQLMADELGDKGFKNLVNAGGSYKHAQYNLWENKTSDWYDNTLTNDKTETYTDILALAFTNTIDTLIARYGNDISQWEWGKHHTFTLEHPLSAVEVLNRVFKLNRGPYPLPGHKYTVTNYAFDILGHEPEVVHGASQRHIYDLADWDKSYTVIPTGNSGVPGAIYYCNQTDWYVNGQYHQDHYSKKAYTEKARWKATYNAVQ